MMVKLLMNKIKLLDCTLREAPVEGLQYGEHIIKGFIYNAVKSGLDIIEVGFLKDVIHKSGSAIFRTVEEIKPYLPTDRQGCMFTALVDYGRYSLENLSEYDGSSIDGIRLCFKKHEWRDAIQLAKKIKDKGYKVFFQHVDSMDYSDFERLEIIEEINRLKPYGYSIVDTFGCMYQDDMEQLFTIVNKNLSPDIILGFHAHNNLMMASALAQDFVCLGSKRNRPVMVDSTILGAGRGAGNAHTELIMQYLNKQHEASYDLDTLLDIIDVYMPVIISKCSWGYSIPYFLSGINSTHVFNVNYLLNRHNIKAKDLRAIINGMDEKKKKQYDYDYLEELYLSQVSHQVDDHKGKNILCEELSEKKVLVLALGSSIKKHKNSVLNYIANEHPIVIGINSQIADFSYNYIFFGNVHRYESALLEENFKSNSSLKSIILSSIKTTSSDNEIIINYLDLITRKKEFLDNSGIMLLKLLGNIKVSEIVIAGMDGYSIEGEKDYAENHLISLKSAENVSLFNEEFICMMKELKQNELKDIPVHFLTPSIYKSIFEE